MAQLIVQYKKENDEASKKPKLVKGKFKTVKPKVGYVSRAVRDYYAGDLKNAKWSDKKFHSALSVADRVMKTFLNPERTEVIDFVVKPGKPQLRLPGHSGRFFLV